MTTAPCLATEQERRTHYRVNIPYVFDATAEVYYACWGEFFHFALFEPGETLEDFTAALERTHGTYFDAMGGTSARSILEVACGGGAFTEWLADRVAGPVLGVDLSPHQLARARARLGARAARRDGAPDNLRFLEHDAMRLDELAAEPFDAVVCLDAACYFPDRARVLRGIAGRLRPGGRLLLVDWCRAEQVTPLLDELVLEPFYRLWAIPSLETVGGYRRAFERAGLRLVQADDVSGAAALNWERSYRAALSLLALALPPLQLLQVAAGALRHGAAGVKLLEDQFVSVLLAKAAADAGALRYVRFVAERA